MESYIEQIVKSINQALSKGIDVLSFTIDETAVNLHAVLENYLNIIITLQIFGKPMALEQEHLIFNEILKQLRFQRKVEILSKARVISDNTRRYLLSLNDIRIANVHPLLAKEKSKVDIEGLKGVFEDLKKSIIKSIDSQYLKSARFMDGLKKSNQQEMGPDSK